MIGHNDRKIQGLDRAPLRAENSLKMIQISSEYTLKDPCYKHPAVVTRQIFWADVR